MYEKQTYSKDARQMLAAYEYLLGQDNPTDLVQGKYFKTHYRGKLTKRMERAEKLQQKGLLMANSIKW